MSRRGSVWNLMAYYTLSGITSLLISEIIPEGVLECDLY